MDLRSLDAEQLDALREIANIGAGHAATALSNVTHERVMVSIPDVRIVPLEEAGEVLGDPGQVVAAVMMQILGDVTGRTVQIFPAATAARLVGTLSKRADLAFPDDFGAPERAQLEELGNLIVNAYVDTLAEMMGLLMIRSPGEFAIDMLGAVLATSYVNFGDVNEHILCMNTQLLLEGGDTDFGGSFLLLPDAASLQVILQSLRLA
jgi:chemotaxis protein CheC